MIHTPPLPNIQRTANSLRGMRRAHGQPSARVGRMRRPRADLPILGRAQGGQGVMCNDHAEPIGWTYRPPSLLGVTRAFAIFVTGDSMMPEYGPGDLVAVDPRRTPSTGDTIIIETDDHFGLIKGFDRWTYMRLHAHQHNPAMTLVFDRKVVRQVFVVDRKIKS